MSFINGLEALIAGAVAGAAVLAFYFLKLKRKEHVISSTLLWRKTLNDLAVNSPFQKLRSSLLLFLQLLLVGAAAVALARPIVNMAVGTKGDILLLIDVSSSMNAREGGATRLEQAKEAARGVVTQMSAEDSMMILTFAGRCDVAQSFTSSKSDLERAISRIKPSEGSTNLEDALSVAIGMARSRGMASADSRQRILIISDGGFPDLESMKIDGHITARGIRIFTADQQRKRSESFDLPLEFVSIGNTKRNVAITHIDTRQTGPKSIELFVAVENFADAPADATLTVYDRGPDGKADDLLGAVDLPLDGNGKPTAKTSRVFEIPQVQDTLLELVLEVDDDLAVDNQAWLPIRKPKEPSVLLVTSGNFFLEKALTPEPDSQQIFSMITPAAYPPDVHYDVTVFDGWAPASIGPGGYLFIGAVPPVEGVLPGKTIEYPALLDWDHAHPVCRFVNFSQINVVKAQEYKLPNHARKIVEGDRCPLIFSLSEIDKRIVCTTFGLLDKDLRLNTDWPFRVSFPVFLTNTMSWLGEQVQGKIPAVTEVGSPLVFGLPQGASSATIIDPSGAEHTANADRGNNVSFAKTATAGAYHVEIDGSENTWVASNLLSRQESNIAVRQSFNWHGSEIAGDVQKKRAPRDFWKLFGLLAVLGLLGEWYVYHRHAR